MQTVNYTSPLVPVEWIAAHAMRPRRLMPGSQAAARQTSRGLCPFASAVLDELASLGGDSLTVLVSTCDQMRHVAAVHQQRRLGPLFLLPLPATWETDAAGRLYRDELRRLGDWLVAHGGRAPTSAELARTLLEYDAARRSIVNRREQLSGKQFALALADPLGAAADNCPALARRASEGKPLPQPRLRVGPVSGHDRPPDSSAIRLALLGGPMLAADYEIYSLIERLGGRIALDAMEGGERTLPTLSAGRVHEDPLGALIEAYYGQLPDAFRRPDHRLHQWLRGELVARRIEGLILWRYVWCDLWHAELRRLEENCGIGVLDLDAGLPDHGGAARLEGRLEAFLETLRHTHRAEALP